MGLLGRLRGARSPRTSPAPTAPTEPEPAGLSEEERDSLLEHLRDRAAVEFLTASGPFEAYATELTDDAIAGGLPHAEAVAVVRREWDRRVRLAREHADEDMSGALRRAFVALESDGIVARKRLGRDDEEGHSRGRQAAWDAGAEGYVFFHHQDAERLVGGPGTLRLRYGAVPRAGGQREPDLPGTAAEAEAVGRRVVAALEQQGLPVERIGSASAVIEVPQMAWYAMPGPR